MIKPQWSVRLIIRYTLLQIPGLIVVGVVAVLLQTWFAWPSWVVWAALIVWGIKDVVLFPFIWQAYDWEGTTAAHSMIGRRGITKDRLAPVGYVQIGNERWKAEAADSTNPIEAGQPIEVKSVRGLRLAVEQTETGN